MMVPSPELEGRTSEEVIVTVIGFSTDEDELRRLLEPHGIKYRRSNPDSFGGSRAGIEVKVNSTLGYSYSGDEAKRNFSYLYSRDLWDDIQERLG